MKLAFKKTLAAAALGLVAGLASTSASAEFLDFKVNETVIPGTVPNTFTADKLNGGYTEFLQITGPGTFSAAAVANFGQFFMNEGTTLVSSNLNGLGAAGYQLYAIFKASGVVTGPNQFLGTSASFSLYVDEDSNTTFNSFNTAASGTATPVADAGTATLDKLVASTSTFVSGSGNLNGPPGAFDIVFKDFLLTAFGSTYFYDPVPFHMVVDVNGDYDTFTSGAPLPAATSRITGDVSAVFVTPEPDSVALIGLALAGMGLVLRRRKAA